MIKLQTKTGVSIDSALLRNYFKTLIDSYFKILPMKESGTPTLKAYMNSLQIEMIGCHELVTAIKDDSMYLSLLAILQYFIDNPDCSVGTVKREVFKAITLCNKLVLKYSDKEVEAV